MSWNNALPWWVWELGNEKHLALCSCCMENEWIPEWSRSCPDHVYKIKKEMYEGSL